MKATKTIKKRQLGWRHVGFGIGLRCLSRNQQRRQWFLNVRTIKLFLQSSALANENCAGDGMEQYAISFRNLIGLAQEGAARFVLETAQTTGTNERLQFLLQEAEVTGRIIVENNEVYFQSFVMKILVTTDKLLNDRQIFRLIDPRYQDR